MPDCRFSFVKFELSFSSAPDRISVSELSNRKTAQLAHEVIEINNKTHHPPRRPAKPVLKLLLKRVWRLGLGGSK